MDQSLPLSNGGRRYGFRPSPKDERDLPAKLAFHTSLVLPPSVDLEQWTGPVKDQGQEGSCTAHAGSENLEFLYKKLKSEDRQFSPQFLYYCERDYDGTLSQGDCGSYGRTAVIVMQKYGCCQLATDPYDTSQMNTPPTDAQWTEAKEFMAGAYHAINSLNDMKCCLASGFTFLLGFNVSENFETDIGSDGIMPPPGGGIIGGHEVLVIGYSDTMSDPKSNRTGYFKIRNSWGSDWGSNGDFFMAYEDIMAVMSEAWIQHFGPPWK